MKNRLGSILAVDDNEDILFSLKLLLRSHVEMIKTTTSPNRIPELLEEHDFDVILLDMNFSQDSISGQEGFHWLEKILEIDPEAIVIFITAYGDAEKAVRAIKAGATDFIIKPWHNEKLIATISSAVKLRRSRLEAGKLKTTNEQLNAIMDQPFHEFIGQSPEMQEVFNTISKVAHTDANVLITGENGTGKELVARALYRESARCNEIFVSVDLGSLTETLFESELFGHVKGAFTDARKDKPGRFELAHTGTIFLDEIGNLSLPLQQKLLTVIERREVTRVGANKPVSVDVRLICATNNNLHQLVADEKFRQDLLFRINTIEIHLPPLRERTGDVPLLAEHFFSIYRRKYNKDIKGISPTAMNKLTRYHWPGNVRELQHAMERAVIMCDGNRLDEDDFVLSAGRQKADDELGIDTFNLEELEKKVIMKVLKMNQGNITKASEELGLTRTSLYRRMEKYDL